METETNPTSAISTALSSLLELVETYGWFSLLGALAIVGIIYYRESLFKGLGSIFTSCVNGWKMQERVEQMEKELKSEREECTARIDKLEAKIEEMNERIINQASEIATLKERLANHVGRKSRGNKNED